MAILFDSPTITQRLVLEAATLINAEKYMVRARENWVATCTYFISKYLISLPRLSMVPDSTKVQRFVP